jgi:hypothetical protein
MIYKQVSFIEAADRWLDRHRDISELKIINIVRYRSGEITEKDDGTYVIRTTTIVHGKPIDLFIKARDRVTEILIEVLVMKIHSGHLDDIDSF